MCVEGDLDSTFQYLNILMLALFFLQLADFDRKFNAQCLMLRLRYKLCLYRLPYVCLILPQYRIEPP